MSDTIPNLNLPANTWVDIYDATGIVVGVALIVNIVKAQSTVVGAIQELTPAPAKTGVPIPYRSSGLSAVVTAGESGFWLYAPHGALVSIQEG